MVAAVSAGVLQHPASASEGEGVSYHWFKIPDLNRATHRLIGRSGSGWTFETICRLLHHVGRIGRPQAKKAARDLGRLGVGLQAIADEAGVSVAKVRRDLVKLADLGLICVSRRNVTFMADPATGKIVENRTGRSMAVVVFLTIGPQHLRTKAGQDRPAANPPKMEPGNPANLEGPPLRHRDQFGGAIQRDCETERTPDGDAVSIGTPPVVPGGRLAAAEAPGLPAGEAGGHAAAKASREGVTVRVDAGSDGLPVPVGRISRPASRPPQERRSRPSGRTAFPEDHREPQAFRGQDADRFAATHRRLAAEEERRRQEDAAWRARREADQASADDPDILLLTATIEAKKAAGAAGKAVAR